MNILIVEDDPVNRLVLTFFLEEKSQNVIVAENGKEGLEVFNGKQDFDIIITDIMMPEIDGISMAREIRNGKKHPEIPIIAITAGGFKSSEIPDSPFSRLLSKPISLADLPQKMCELIGQGAIE
ncbi:response regulator [Echinicola jeungdonensis]|uniref:Response regulator n=1 Tax=Echinicola jeungdonensis TaxID=709343 RepID=A0ABV5J190_9BACT|nr:response regulator [Echinicola jeungdonensis]MDN3668423.1 response regulator [Echinicola jeungdonensis]